MPISPHVAGLRAKVGSMRLLLPSVTALVFDHTGGLLLVRQADGGVWSTPGGLIEPDETPEAAVVREAREETGLLVEPVRVATVLGGPEFVVRYPGGDETQYVMTMFECRVLGGELRADGDETLEAGYWSAADAAALPLAPWLRHALPVVYDLRRRPTTQPSARPLVGVACLVTRAGRVLLLRRQRSHGTGSWSPPGGHLDFGETPEACAIRETAEETGLRITHPTFFAVTNDLFESDGKHYLTVWMRAESHTGDPSIQDPAEVGAIDWFAPDALPSPLFLSLANLLAGRALPASAAGLDLSGPPSPGN